LVLSIFDETSIVSAFFGDAFMSYINLFVCLIVTELDLMSRLGTHIRKEPLYVVVSLSDSVTIRVC